MENSLYIDLSKEAKINKICDKVEEMIEVLDFGGGCHSISAVLYVLFNEIGLDAKLCLGEVYSLCNQFSHSWVDVEGYVYDIAIIKGLNGSKISDKIIKGNGSGVIKHGGGNISDLDFEAKAVLFTPFIAFMDNFPIEMFSSCEGVSDFYDVSSYGLWGFIIKIGSSVGLDLNIDVLREKYKNTKRIYC